MHLATSAGLVIVTVKSFLFQVKYKNASKSNF